MTDKKSSHETDKTSGTETGEIVKMIGIKSGGTDKTNVTESGESEDTNDTETDKTGSSGDESSRVRKEEMMELVRHEAEDESIIGMTAKRIRPSNISAFR